MTDALVPVVERKRQRFGLQGPASPAGLDQLARRHFGGMDGPAVPASRTGGQLWPHRPYERRTRSRDGSATGGPYGPAKELLINRAIRLRERPLTQERGAGHDQERWATAPSGVVGDDELHRAGSGGLHELIDVAGS